MGMLDEFFATHQDAQERLLGTVTLQVAGQSIPVVWDAFTRSKSGTLGGLDNNTLATAVCQPKNVSGDPVLLLGKRATVDGRNYRVQEVEVGTVAITFTLIDPASKS
jgi:hypothetical protein